MIPFVLLLAGIAVLPLIPATAHWWESNLNRFKVAGGLALVTLRLLRVSAPRGDRRPLAGTSRCRAVGRRRANRAS